MTRVATAEESVARLATTLRSRVDELALTVIERARQAEPGWTVDRPELADLSYTLARNSIDAELAALAGGRELPKECPRPDVEYAAGCARLGAPLTVVSAGVPAWPFGAVVGVVGSGRARVTIESGRLELLARRHGFHRIRGPVECARRRGLRADVRSARTRPRGAAAAPYPGGPRGPACRRRGARVRARPRHLGFVAGDWIQPPRELGWPSGRGGTCSWYTWSETSAGDGSAVASALQIAR